MTIMGPAGRGTAVQMCECTLAVTSQVIKDFTLNVFLKVYLMALCFIKSYSNTNYQSTDLNFVE